MIKNAQLFNAIHIAFFYFTCKDRIRAQEIIALALMPALAVGVALNHGYTMAPFLYKSFPIKSQIWS